MYNDYRKVIEEEMMRPNSAYPRIRTIVNDAKLLQGLNEYHLSCIRKYLENTGWTKHGFHPEGFYQVFRYGKKEEVLGLIIPNLADQAPRVADILEAVERIEQRSQLEILTDMLATTP